MDVFGILWLLLQTLELSFHLIFQQRVSNEENIGEQEEENEAEAETRLSADEEKEMETNEPEVIRGNSRKRKRPQPSILLVGGQETRYRWARVCLLESRSIRCAFQGNEPLPFDHILKFRPSLATLKQTLKNSKRTRKITRLKTSTTTGPSMNRIRINGSSISKEEETIAVEEVRYSENLLDRI